MAVYFSLLDKHTGERVALAEVDNRMRNHFNAPAGENWYQAWYHLEGLALAMGKSFEELRLVAPDRSDISDFLEQHYTVENWAGR